MLRTRCCAASAPRTEVLRGAGASVANRARSAIWFIVIDTLGSRLVLRQRAKKPISERTLTRRNKPIWSLRPRGFLSRPPDPFISERVAIARGVEAVYVVALLVLVALLPLRDGVTWVDWSLYATIFTL